MHCNTIWLYQNFGNRSWQNFATHAITTIIIFRSKFTRMVVISLRDFLLVSHLRLSQQKDDTVEGWFKHFFNFLVASDGLVFFTTHSRQTRWVLITFQININWWKRGKRVKNEPKKLKNCVPPQGVNQHSAPTSFKGLLKKPHYFVFLYFFQTKKMKKMIKIKNCFKEEKGLKMVEKAFWHAFRFTQNSKAGGIR